MSPGPLRVVACLDVGSTDTKLAVVSVPGGDLVVVSRGVLYVVDPTTGAADRIEVPGRQLTGGDGLELRGRTLYVVNGYGGDEVVAAAPVDEDDRPAVRVGRRGRRRRRLGLTGECRTDGHEHEEGRGGQNKGGALECVHRGLRGATPM